MNLKKSLLGLSLLSFSISFSEQTIVNLPKTSIKVGFSPKDGITQMISSEIEKAKESIDVAAYSFTSKKIALKLIDAKDRKVKVRLVLDKSQRKAKGSVAQRLIQEGVDVRFNEKYKIQHNKYMIIDQKHVECGSFNYTKAAEHYNAENAIIIQNSPEFAKVYTLNFKKLWDEAGF
jgi:phosphatidylserine/phosphatidylglycerophosphate/cardiolipin synthase-like enzyme